jgi:small-conductance mechanosensitive channel
MNGEFSLKTAAIDVLQSLSSAIAGFVPRFFTALVVVLLGVLLAKLVARAIRGAFDRLMIDALLERVGLTALLQRVGLREAPGRLVARLVYWLLVLLFVQSAAAAIGLTAISGAIDSFFGYLPNLVAAVVVLLAGAMISRFVGDLITRAADESGIEFAATLGRAAATLILFVVAVMAVSQLRIDTALIKSVVLVVLGGFAAAIALSFGLGTRDITRNIVAGYYAKKLFTIGEEIEVGGQRGVLVGVTAQQVLLEQDGRTVTVPNKVFIEEAVRQ